MSNTTRGVFGDEVPRRGSKTYESINEYLKHLDLGRVKTGFTGQSESSRPAWENAVRRGKAVGYYGSRNEVYGIMKSLFPLGIGAGVASQRNGGKVN